MCTMCTTPSPRPSRRPCRPTRRGLPLPPPHLPSHPPPLPLSLAARSPMPLWAPSQKNSATSSALPRRVMPWCSRPSCCCAAMAAASPPPVSNRAPPRQAPPLPRAPPQAAPPPFPCGNGNSLFYMANGLQAAGCHGCPIRKERFFPPCSAPRPVPVRLRAGLSE